MKGKQGENWSFLLHYQHVEWSRDLVTVGDLATRPPLVALDLVLLTVPPPPLTHVGARALAVVPVAVKVLVTMTVLVCSPSANILGWLGATLEPVGHCQVLENIPYSRAFGSIDAGCWPCLPSGIRGWNNTFGGCCCGNRDQIVPRNGDIPCVDACS